MTSTFQARLACWCAVTFAAGEIVLMSGASLAAPASSKAAPPKPGGASAPAKTAPGPAKAAAQGPKRAPDQPSFSPDGKRVVYVEKEFSDEFYLDEVSGHLWILDLATKKARRLTVGHMDEYPRFSPDGKRVVFTRDHDIWMIEADGTNLQNITNTPGDMEGYPEFSTDGTSLLFIRDFDGEAEDAKYFSNVPVMRSLADGSERVLLGDAYNVKRVVPNPAQNDRVYILCKRLDAKGKPVPEVTLDPAVAEFKLDGTWLRTLYVPKQGADKIDSGVRSGNLRAINGGVMMGIYRGIDSSTHFLTDAGMKTLPDTLICDDVTLDGATVLGTGSPRGSMVRSLEFYDVATRKSLYLNVTGPAQTVPTKVSPAPAKLPATPAPAGAAVKPTTATEFLTRADEHYRAGRYDEAIRDYSEALRLDPKSAPALLGRGKSKEFKPDFEGAMADYDAAVKMDPKLVQAHIERGFLLFARTNSGEAIDAYTTAIQLDPKNLEALTLRGEAYASRVEYAEAIADFDAALAIDPDHLTALTERGKAFFETEDYPAALKDYNRALELLPRDKKFLLRRADIHRKMGNADAAKADETAANG